MKNNYGRFLFLIIIPLGFFLYRDALSASFVYDDRAYITGNFLIRSLNNFLDFSGTRYIGLLSFALNYKIGGLLPFGYHFVNILIHIINSILVFFLIINTFDTPAVTSFFKERDDAQKISICLAVTSSVVFLTHPIESQAVSYVTQRFASLAALFYLSALLFYAKARIILLKPGEEKFTAGFKVKAWGFYLASLASTVLAMKTKEISFTLPFAIVLYDFMFFGAEFNRGAKLRIPFYFTLFIIPLAVLGLDRGITGGNQMAESLRDLQLKEAAGLSRSVYMLTELSVLVTYLRLLFYPVNQSIDYDYPLSHSFFELRTFLSFVLLFSLFLLAVIVLIRKRNNAWGLFFSFGIFWFFLASIVESFLVPIQDVIFEQRAYLPGIGIIISFFSAVFYAVEYLRRYPGIRISHGAVLALVLILILPPLSIALNKRNKLWCEETLLLNDAISKNPQKGRLYGALGVVHLERKEYALALDDFNKAISKDLKIAPMYYFRGLTYMGLEKYPEAIENLSMAIKSLPDEHRFYMNRAVAYAAAGEYEGSIRDIAKSIELNPANRAVIEGKPFAGILKDIMTVCNKKPVKGCEVLKK